MHILISKNFTTCLTNPSSRRILFLYTRFNWEISGVIVILSEICLILIPLILESEGDRDFCWRLSKSNLN